MEFKATIVIDVSPALLRAFNRIADVMSATKVLNPVHVENCIISAENGLPEMEIQSESTTAIKTETVSVPEPQPQPEVAPVKFTKEQVKAAAAAKKEKRDEMKKILDDMGVKSIPALSEDQYEEFMQKISVL